MPTSLLAADPNPDCRGSGTGRPLVQLRGMERVGLTMEHSGEG
jgi:hypothetical protein